LGALTVALRPRTDVLFNLKQGSKSDNNTSPV
jgi:hypothetical protein